MKTYIYILVLAILLGSCKANTVLRTYSMTVELELINECSGKGVDNPTSALVFTDINYINATPDKYIKDIPLVLQPDGVTSKGSYKFKTTRTSLKGKSWNVEVPRLCKYILCPRPKKCVNIATTTIMPIAITKKNMTYIKRYTCSCN